jgi:acyl carrier protein
MTSAEVLGKLRDLLAEDFKIPAAKVTPAATFRGTLGMDSLDAVDLIYLVGKTFGIKATVDQFKDLHSVEKIVDFVLAKKAAQQA